MAFVIFGDLELQAGDVLPYGTLSVTLPSRIRDLAVSSEISRYLDSGGHFVGTSIKGRTNDPSLPVIESTLR